MKKIIVAFTFAIAVTAAGNYTYAQQHNHQDHSGHEHAQHGQAVAAQAGSIASHKVNPAFQTQISSLFNASLELKDAFVDSDAAKVKSQAEVVKKALAKVDMKQVQGQAHQDWMKYQKELDKHISAIAKSNSLEEQRKYYAPFNEALYKTVKAFGIGEKEVYYQYCPMALNNQGAYWLSDNKEIRNPYFGSSMLKCGRVKETIKQ